MEKIIINNYEFIKDEFHDIVVVFSTSRGDLDFHKSTNIGQENLNKLKEWFGVDNVGYLHQIHSDYIFKYDEKLQEGDGLITTLKNTAIGVFTADCVPILICDPVAKVISAVHSGWRGTEQGIVYKTIKKMRCEYGASAHNIKVYIGPHIMDCCYEVGEEVKKKFIENNNYNYDYGKIFNGRKLSLQDCILSQLKLAGVEENNIHTVNACTLCSKDYELHSYRKDGERSGRLFSFIFMR